jgi:hypothetical protein
MASSKYIGYVGGVAVAVGVGAAMAAASQGTAYAETESAPSASDSASSSDPSGAVDAGPKKPDSEADGKTDETGKDQTGKTETGGKAGNKPSSLSKKLRQSAKDFEAEQVEKLRSVFTPRDVVKDTEKDTEKDTDEPEAKRDSVSDADAADTSTPARLVREPDPAAESAEAPVAATAAEPVPWSPDPFRPDDPEPDDMPDAVLTLRDLLVGAAGPEFRPYVREGVEAIYRGSQIVPWVNVVVPAYKIVPAFLEAAQGNKAGAQIIINELLKTTGPVSLLYYGYDQIADLANMEFEARLLKEQFYSTAWDTLDPFALLHEYGDHGLRG